MKITILGSGTSHGIPMIGCRCSVCTSDNPRNHRRRASCLVRSGGRNLLIDTVYELRLQCLDAGIDHLDAVLYTHEHADHVCGFDDVRRFCELRDAALPVFASPDCIARLRAMFPYATEPGGMAVGLPVVSFNVVEAPFQAAGVPVTPVPLFHGRWACYGYRIGDLAYCTDVKEIPPPSMEMLRGLDVLVLGALRHREHVTHMTVAQALDVISELKPRRAFLTHIAHDLEHEATNAALPEGVELAYDGLVIETDEP